MDSGNTQGPLFVRSGFGIQTRRTGLALWPILKVWASLRRCGGLNAFTPSTPAVLESRRGANFPTGKLELRLSQPEMSRRCPTLVKEFGPGGHSSVTIKPRKIDDGWRREGSPYNKLLLTLSTCGLHRLATQFAIGLPVVKGLLRDPKHFPGFVFTTSFVFSPLRKKYVKSFFQLPWI